MFSNSIGHFEMIPYITSSLVESYKYTLLVERQVSSKRQEGVWDQQLPSNP